MERVLKLTLNKQAFDITGTPEKPFELRKKTKWIESRLLDKMGNKRVYDFIELRNGYSANCPFKKVPFFKIVELQENRLWKFSNGLEFETESGDYIIYFTETELNTY